MLCFKYCYGFMMSWMMQKIMDIICLCAFVAIMIMVGYHYYIIYMDNLDI